MLAVFFGIRTCSNKVGDRDDVMRMTAKQYRQRGKRSKYGNKKVGLGGITFDSKAEARYFKELQLRERAKDISFFRLQPKFQVMPKFEKDGKKHQAIHYIADFEIHHLDGSIEVVDVKSEATITQVFRIKEKLFHKKFPHKLTLVKWENGRFVEV